MATFIDEFQSGVAYQAMKFMRHMRGCNGVIQTPDQQGRGFD
jgi:hypothetical protein